MYNSLNANILDRLADTILSQSDELIGPRIGLFLRHLYLAFYGRELSLRLSPAPPWPRRGFSRLLYNHLDPPTLSLVCIWTASRTHKRLF